MKYKKILLIVLLILILDGIVIGYIIKNTDSEDLEYVGNTEENEVINFSNNTEQKEENKNILKSNSEIKSALVEQIEPHASYYLEEIYVEENQYIEKGANILKYTNGTYLTAPYDCVITKVNLPGIAEKLLNSHYVEVSSNNALEVTLNVDEEKINQIKTGLSAKIKITTLGKEYTGYVTKVASIASKGKFQVTIEFENDKSIKLGMTASVELEI